MFMPPVFPAHWHVSQPVLIADTFSSLVWKVSLPDGTPAIVKGLKPIEDIADELRGADYLVWRNGRGAVRLLGRENNLMLLEYAGERMLSHIVAEHGDYQATEIAAELMAKLYAASEEPLPSALLPIRDRFAALFQRARDDQNAGCQTDYVHAAIIADQMMSNASELRGLHGDLHHENIMFSSRGWLVIDPVGLVGEVGFGAANSSTIRLTETTFVSILDALHRWRTHSLVRWTSIRVACSTRRTLMGAFPQLGTRMEKRSNAI